MSQTETAHDWRHIDPPHVSVELGYVLALLGKVHDDSRMGTLIHGVLDNFQSSARRYEPDTNEGRYYTMLLTSALSFARGIQRRKEDREERLAAARQMRDMAVRRVVESERVTGLLRGGLHLLILGGFAYVFARACFEMPWFGRVAESHEPQFASLATAFATVLVGSSLKGWWHGKLFTKILLRFDSRMNEINETYRGEVEAEYRLAAQTAELAWEQLTGERAPTTKAFSDLLLDVVHGKLGIENVEP